MKIAESLERFSLKVEMDLLAMVLFMSNITNSLDELEVQFKRGNIKYDNDYQTTSKGVYVAGDAVREHHLLWRAIYQGTHGCQCSLQLI